MDYARLNLLQSLRNGPDVVTTVAADFTDMDSWLADAQLLITYVAGSLPKRRTEQQPASMAGSRRAMVCPARPPVVGKQRE